MKAAHTVRHTQGACEVESINEDRSHRARTSCVFCRAGIRWRRAFWARARVCRSGRRYGPGSSGVGGWTLAETQWLAAQFSLGAATTITDVQGWIGGGPGSATAAIYTDGGDVPGFEFLSAEFTAAAPEGWCGPAGLNWLLVPGDYWVAYQVQAGQTLFGHMSNPSTFPLLNEAHGDAPWVANDNLNFGVRIFGTTAVAAIPEPSTYALMLAGLGFVAFVANRRRKAQIVAK